MNPKRAILVYLLLFPALLLAACGGRAAAKAPGNAEAGQVLFNQTLIKDAPGCATCHSVEPDKILVGPSLAGVATRAASRVPGVTAPEYLRDSIANPDNYVVAGFQSGVMYQKWKQTLTSAELDDLVAYLLTLE
jgi:sulfur-oxidizing protein SoxX